MKFIETKKTPIKSKNLRNRIILYTRVASVYRFGAQIVLPGIDAAMLVILQEI